MANRIVVGVIIVIFVAGGVYFANLARESDMALRVSNEAVVSAESALESERKGRKRLEEELQNQKAELGKERMALTKLREDSTRNEENILKLRESIQNLKASEEESTRKRLDRFSLVRAAAENTKSALMAERKNTKILEAMLKDQRAALEAGKKEALQLREVAGRYEAGEKELRIKMAEDTAAAAEARRKQAAALSSLNRTLESKKASLLKERETKNNLEAELRKRETDLREGRVAISNLEKTLKKSKAGFQEGRITIASLNKTLKGNKADLQGKRALINKQENLIKEGGSSLVLERKKVAHLSSALATFEVDILKLQKTAAGKSVVAEEFSRKLLATKASLIKMDEKHRAAAGQARAEGLRALKLRGSLEELKQKISSNELSLKKTKDLLRIDIVNRLLFDLGSVEINEKGRAALDKLVDFFKGQAGKIIRVEGHTDNQPISGSLARRFPSNWDLSTARAIAVVRYLRAKGISPQRLSATGYSFYREAASNETAEGRARNRRIVILMSRSKPSN